MRNEDRETAPAQPLAVISDQLGDLSLYQLREFDPGAPADDEVRIAVATAGVSFVDILNARGQYQIKAPVPFIPGSEFAGTVVAVGRHVTSVCIGQRVMASRWGGAFAEYALVKADSVSAIPDNMSFDHAAVFKVSALTVWHALVDRGALAAGETLLVLGAGGATGFAAVQLGCYLGAKVIASASTPDKRELALAAGAQAAIDTTSPHWRDELLEATDGRSVDVVFDPVGGEGTVRAFRTLHYGSRHLVVGFPGGIAALPTNLPLLKNASLVGVNIQAVSQHRPELALENQRQVMALAEQGMLMPAIARQFPLADFMSAMAMVEAGEVAGRVILEVSAERD